MSESEQEEIIAQEEALHLSSERWYAFGWKQDNYVHRGPEGWDESFLRSIEDLATGPYVTSFDHEPTEEELNQALPDKPEEETNG